MHRVALTLDQVKKFNLAPNPTKIADPRSADYLLAVGDQCWELDALPPDELEKIVKRSINVFIDTDVWNENVELIEKEKKELQKKFESMKISFAKERKK